MIRNIFRLILAWLPPILLMAIIFFLSSQQNISVSDEMSVNFSFFKTLHIVEYALLTFLFFRALVLTKSLLDSYAVSLSASMSLIYGISDEIHQTFVPSRAGHPRDVLIDSIGILLMALFLYKNRVRIKKLLRYTTF